MKKFLFLFALLCSCGLFAQNWTPFPYNQESWFEFENPTHYSKSVYYADSLIENGDTNNYYFHVRYLDNLIFNCLSETYFGDQTWLDYYDPQTSSFISIKTPVQQVNGNYYLNGNFVFDHTLEVGQSTTIYPTNFDEIQITCTNKTTESIFGITDSVKIFSLKAYNNGQPVDSDYDNHQYKLSKNYGFLTFLPFIELLTTPQTTVKLLGFEDSNDILQGTKAWTVADFIPYEAGDVLYYKQDFYDFTGELVNVIYGIDSITSRNIIGDSLIYTYYNISPTTGAINSIEYTRNIWLNDPQYSMFSKSIYNFDFSYEYCTSSNDAINYMYIYTDRDDFSFVDGEDSYDLTFSCDMENLTPSCNSSSPNNFSSHGYNTALGPTYTYFALSGDEEVWSLLIYKKDEEEYNPLIASLQDTYSCTDDPIYLINESSFYWVEFNGIGVDGNYFDPAFVPEALHGTPITINYVFKEFCYPTTCDSLILHKSIIVNCGTTPGDCGLSNFNVVSTNCNGFGELYIDIDFDFENPGAEGFAIMINGTEFNSYSYQTLYLDGVISLGPFTADGTTDWEIYVSDNENQASCSTNSITVDAQTCQGSACQISNLMVIPTCDALGRYQVDISFDYQGTVGNNFQVYSWNSFFPATISYTELDQNGFVSLDSYYNGSGNEITFLVVDSLSTDCRDSITITLDCLIELCGIENLSIDELTDSVCTDGGTFNIDFDHPPNNTYDLIWLNPADTFYREYGVQPPFQINFDSISPGTYEKTLLLIIDSENPCCKPRARYIRDYDTDNDCSNSEFFSRFNTFNANGFAADYEIEKVNNNEDFLIHITNGTFNYENYWDNFPIAMFYGYTILVNGVPVGEYRIPEDIEVTIGPFPADSETKYLVEITSLCIDQGEGSERIWIGLVGPNDCVLANSFISTEPCDINDDFYFNIGFEYGGATTDSFSIDLNGAPYADHSYTGGDLQFKGYVTAGPFRGDGISEYTFDVYDSSGECSFTISATAPLCPAPENAELSLRVFLEGAYDPTTRTMTTALADQYLLPLSQPYNVPPWNYTGTETLDNMPLDVVDWVLVEMRGGTPSETGEATTYIVESKAGLLLSNGEVVDTNNESLSFENLVQDEPYHIVVRHRNHLDVISSSQVDASSNMSYDFTATTNNAFGPLQQKAYPDGTATLFAGDYTTDGIIQNSDSDAWLINPASLYTYDPIDGNLDGIVQITDYDTWYLNRSKIGVVEIRY